ncbi:MAG: hypothetical protein ABSB31_10700 [Dehalococcoidia bacterium]
MSAQQHSWADPTPACLYSQAVGFLALGTLFAGIVPALSAVLLIPWFFGIALVCIIGGLILLRNNDVYGGTLNFIVGAVFLTSGNWASLLIKFIGLPLAQPTVGTLAQLPIPTQMEGYAFGILIIFLVVGGILGLRLAWWVGVMLFVVALAVLFGPCIWNLMGAPGVPTDPAAGISNPFCLVSGILFIIFALMNLYLATSLWVLHTTGKLVLPIGKPWLK